MLNRFTVATVKKTEREYEYHDYPFTGPTKKAIEYIYELTAEDGDRYFLFHQRKTDATLRPHKIMYVSALKMETRDGTKYSAPYEAAYRVKRTYTKEEFNKEVALSKTNLEDRQKKDAAELSRLAALS